MVWESRRDARSDTAHWGFSTISVLDLGAQILLQTLIFWTWPIANKKKKSGLNPHVFHANCTDLPYSVSPYPHL